MRKIYIAFLMLFLETPFLQAQTYHPLIDTGKLWSTYHFNLIPNPPTSDYTKFDGDTTIGVYSYKIIWFSLDEGMTQWNKYGFIREDAQKKVFFSPVYTNDERLLYDFNATAGDTLYLMGNPNAFVLDSTGVYMLQSGEQRKSFMLHCTTFPCSETWIEGIGSITFGVLHSGFCGFVGDDPSMLCAWENDTLKYHWTNYPDCFVTVGINDLSQEKQNIRVFPNPANNMITISSTKKIREEIDVAIFTINGERVLQEKFLNQNQVEMNVNTLLKGMYLVKIQTREGLEVKKLVIE